MQTENYKAAHAAVSVLTDNEKESLATSLLEELGFFALNYWGINDIQQHYQDSFSDQEGYPEELTDAQVGDIRQILISSWSKGYDIDSDILSEKIFDYVSKNIIPVES